MNEFWQGPTYKIVQAIKSTGNRPGLIQEWKNTVEHWALRHPGPEADAVLAWLPSWQARPFYTAAELAPIFPTLAVALGITRRVAPAKSAMRLAAELDYAGLPKVVLAAGNLLDADYFIVERVHYWRKRLEQFPGEFLDVLNGS